jgi:predicted N-acetyltransferase YhbS
VLIVVRAEPETDVPAARQLNELAFDRPGEAVRDEAFMAIELVPDALARVRGLVRYHPEFGKV